jgi:hypothetical protein
MRVSHLGESVFRVPLVSSFPTKLSPCSPILRLFWLCSRGRVYLQNMPCSQGRWSHDGSGGKPPPMESELTPLRNVTKLRFPSLWKKSKNEAFLNNWQVVMLFKAFCVMQGPLLTLTPHPTLTLPYRRHLTHLTSHPDGWPGNEKLPTRTQV